MSTLCLFVWILYLKMLFKVTLAYKKCEFTSGVTMIIIVEKTHNIEFKNNKKKAGICK